MNNGLLPVQISEAFLRTIFNEIEKGTTTQLRVNLEKQEIKLLTTGETETFDINTYKKSCLLNGYDDIDFLLSKKDKIIVFEQSRKG